MLFLAIFAAYAILISTSSKLSDEDNFRQLVSALLLSLMFGFGVRMLLEEARQIKAFRRDGTI